MLSRMWGGRRAEAFQNALDGHVEPSDRELNEFVGLARTVSDVPTVQLRDDTRMAMRARLVAEAEHVLTAPATPTRTRPSRRHRGIRVAVGATVVATAMSGGLVSVSANSLPGDLLYPIKIGFERLEGTFNDGPAEAGRSRLEHASNRLDEAERLARAEDVDRVSSTLDDFSNEANAGSEQLLRAFAADSDSSSITAIRTFTHAAAGRLGTIAGILDESTMPAYTEAVETVTAIDRRAISTCPACSAEPPVDVPHSIEPEAGDDTVTLPPITLPGLDDHFGDDLGPNGPPNTFSTNPKDTPFGGDLPPNDEGVPPDNTDNNDNPTDGPTLKPHSGSDQESDPRDESPNGRPKDDDDDGGLLPGLPGLPADRDGSPGNLPRAADLTEIIRPLDDLLGPDGPLGPLGDLLNPLLGNKDGSNKGKDDVGPLEGLLGPLLGDQGDDSDDESPNEEDDSPGGLLDLDSGSDSDSDSDSGDSDSNDSDPDDGDSQSPNEPDQLEPEEGETEQEGDLDELGEVEENDTDSGELDGIEGGLLGDGQ